MTFSFSGEVEGSKSPAGQDGQNSALMDDLERLHWRLGAIRPMARFVDLVSGMYQDRTLVT
jgi:hypothetical protein